MSFLNFLLLVIQSPKLELCLYHAPWQPTVPTWLRSRFWEWVEVMCPIRRSHPLKRKCPTVHFLSLFPSQHGMIHGDKATSTIRYHTTRAKRKTTPGSQDDVGDHGKFLPGTSCPHQDGEMRKKKKNVYLGTCLVVQWLRLHAPNEGGPVQSLVGELDPTCHNWELVCHN